MRGRVMNYNGRPRISLKMVYLSSALTWMFILSASAAQLVRLGEAEVGFRIRLGVPGSAGLEVKAEEMGNLSVATNGSVVTGIWTGHPLLGEDFAATALFSRTDGGWEYSFSWRGMDHWKFMAEEVSFPDLVIPRTNCSRILMPCSHGMGFIYLPEWEKYGWEREPVAEARASSFQFAALLDGERSWYLDARDGEARRKTAYAYCRIGLADPHARIGMRFNMPVLKENTESYVLPWKGIVKSFSGGWWDAARIYRPWAREQKWFKGAMARNATPQKKRLREIGLWVWNRGNSDAVAPPVEWFAENAGVPCALDWYWWHMPGNDTGYPNFWPPREGEKVFGDTIRRLKSKGIYTMVYTNGMSQDMDDPVWADGGDEEAVMQHNLSIHGTPFNVYTRHRLAAMCGDAPRFQKRMEGQVAHLEAAGLDAVYMDQISCAAGAPCWNRHHRHVLGDTLASRNMYRDYVLRVRKANPNLAISSEECSEAFLDLFDSFISLFGSSYERCNKGVLPEVEAVPAWNAIYHDAIACFGTYSLLDGIPPWDDRWPVERRWKIVDEQDWMALFPDQFAVEFCRTVVWGNQPSVHTFRMSHATNPKLAGELRLMMETARFYMENRNFLYDGEMLSPGRMECATKRVEFLQRSIYSMSGDYKKVVQNALPTVFHNVWRDKSRNIAAILVNWSRERQQYSLETPDIRSSGMVPARSWVRIDKGNNGSSLQ